MVTVALAVTISNLSVSAPSSPRGTVQTLVQKRIASLGHRNWIVVADSAYPLQVSAGIETVTVKDSQVSAVAQVISALKKTKHVRPNIFLDKELAFVPEKLAPGVTAYRSAIKKLLPASAKQMLHEDIIKMLDEAGKTFKVLLIKTPHIQPYTSVFFQLECGYWSESAEKQLRDAMKSGG